MTTATRDILSRLRTAPTVTLPKDTALIPAAIAIRKMMVERAEAADEITKLRDALERSVALQSHYASCLNMYDGGTRMEFSSGDAWRNRLVETSKP